MTDKVTDIAQGLLASRANKDWPTILLSHMTYSEADTGFEHLLLEHEPLLTPEAVEGYDLVCLGHIHRPQKINGKVFYCGAPERHSFNDEHVIPGFWIHELAEKGQPIESRFIETPARRFVTINCDARGVVLANRPDLDAPYVKDAIVRVNMAMDSADAKLFDRKDFEKRIYHHEAFYVSEISVNVERTERARDETVTESLLPVEALAKWSEQQGVGEDEIRELIAMANELLVEGVA
jgi:DNA repair exonuclease SbcCD nuclease subunit